MFRSVFAKYISAFLSIILLSFLLLVVVIASIIGNYSQQNKTELMETAAYSSATYLEGRLTESDSASLTETAALGQEDLTAIFSVIVAGGDDLTAVLADGQGRILLAAGAEQQEVGETDVIPISVMESIRKGETVSQSDQLGDVFGEDHYIHAVPVRGADGEVCGTVLICSSAMMHTDLLNVIVKAIVSASLWVLVAALIAVYFISERVIGPLREISRAAKSFASGKFDVRVPVRGSDEVAELAVAFNNMAESMNNYDTMRNTFMSNVSHDLRTPMTSIAGFVDGILDGVIPPEKHEYYLRIVSEEVKRLSRLVSSLLDLSRIQAGERKFTKAPFDICEMGRQILLSFEQRLNDKSLDVSFDCDEENLTVVADRDAIYQIFYNLCDNGVKFAAEGGEFRIAIRKLKNRKILVSVYNEGQGIADADLPYVFERFYKSDKSRGLNKSGVGLGLFIAKTIVDAHGEQIWVDSEYGKSCRFNFTLSVE
ncbi:MAG: HAMP domain-containing histidine kinase [Clostridia bacterium]|nr:HAMP domain-containing histidine kinase [Clostridia bacterium]